MAFITLLLYSLLAGLAGTLVITIIQEIDIRVTGRAISYTPVEAVFKILRLDFESVNERTKVFLSYAVHFTYGIFLGFPLALLYMFDIKGLTLYSIYFLILWGQEILIFSTLRVGCPPWKWGIRTNLKEIMFKLIYTGVVFITFVSPIG